MIAKKLCTLAALTLTSSLVVGAPLAAETIQDAVKTMIETNPDVRSAAHNRLGRDEEVRQAKAGYLPTVNVTAGAGRDWNDEPLGEDLSPNSATLSLRQNVFGFFNPE